VSIVRNWPLVNATVGMESTSPVVPFVIVTPVAGP
jgi:hypothetical protein